MKADRKVKLNMRRDRTRKKIKSVGDRPRLSVFRSNKHIYLQLIDDKNGKILLAVSDKEIKGAEKSKKVDLALEAGALMAKKALEKNIKDVIFDRGGYKYHGRVRSVADGARKGGLNF